MNTVSMATIIASIFTPKYLMPTYLTSGFPKGNKGQKRAVKSKPSGAAQLKRASAKRKNTK